MAVNPPLTIQAKRASLSLSFQPVNNINSTMTTEAFALEKLGQSVNMDIFQELLDLDTPCEMFSKDIVSEFLVMGPETLTTMNDSLYV